MQDKWDCSKSIYSAQNLLQGVTNNGRVTFRVGNTRQADCNLVWSKVMAYIWCSKLIILCQGTRMTWHGMGTDMAWYNSAYTQTALCSHASLPRASPPN